MGQIFLGCHALRLRKHAHASVKHGTRHFNLTDQQQAVFDSSSL